MTAENPVVWVFVCPGSSRSPVRPTALSFFRHRGWELRSRWGKVPFWRPLEGSSLMSNLLSPPSQPQAATFEFLRVRPSGIAQFRFSTPSRCDKPAFRARAGLPFVNPRLRALGTAALNPANVRERGLALSYSGPQARRVGEQGSWEAMPAHCSLAGSLTTPPNLSPSPNAPHSVAEGCRVAIAPCSLSTGSCRNMR